VLSPVPNPAPEPLSNLHFVYQQQQADATLTARLLTATEDAGLMVRADNNNNSPFVFVGVKDNQLQVIQGGDTQTVHDARGANNPVWVRLEKKEDRVDVFQSDDNINYTLLTTVTLALTSPFNMGMVVGATSTTNTTGQATQGQFGEVVLAQADTNTFEVVTVEFAYEIVDELTQSNIVFLDAGPGAVTDITSPQGLIQQGLVNVYSDIYAGGNGNPLNSRVYLIDTTSKLVAIDFVRPSLRNRLIFSHENSARAEVMIAHPLLRNLRDDETWIRIYNAVDQHPRFPDLVSLFQEVGYLPSLEEDPRSNEYYAWTDEIALDLIDEFLYPDGTPKPQSQPTSNAIETQLVVRRDGIDIRHPDYDRSVVEVRNASVMGFNYYAYEVDRDLTTHYIYDLSELGTEDNFVQSAFIGSPQVLLGFITTGAISSTQLTEFTSLPGNNQNCVYYDMVASAWGGEAQAYNISLGLYEFADLAVSFLPIDLSDEEKACIIGQLQITFGSVMTLDTIRSLADYADSGDIESMVQTIAGLFETLLLEPFCQDGAAEFVLKMFLNRLSFDEESVKRAVSTAVTRYINRFSSAYSAFTLIRLLDSHASEQMGHFNTARFRIGDPVLRVNRSLFELNATYENQKFVRTFDIINEGCVEVDYQISGHKDYGVLDTYSLSSELLDSSITMPSASLIKNHTGLYPIPSPEGITHTLSGEYEENPSGNSSVETSFEVTCEPGKKHEFIIEIEPYEADLRPDDPNSKPPRFIAEGYKAVVVKVNCLPTRFYLIDRLDGDTEVEITEEKDGSTFGESVPDGEERAPQLDTDIKIVVPDGDVLTADDVVFEGIDAGSGVVTQEDGLVIYREPVEAIEPGTYTLKATVTTPPETLGDPPTVTIIERNFVIENREVEAELKANGTSILDKSTELDNVPVVGTHIIEHVCEAGLNVPSSYEDAPKVDIRRRARASNEHNLGYDLTSPRIYSAFTEGPGFAGVFGQLGGYDNDTWELDDKDTQRLSSGIYTVTSRTDFLQGDYSYTHEGQFEIELEENEEPDCDGNRLVHDPHIETFDRVVDTG